MEFLRPIGRMILAVCVALIPAALPAQIFISVHFGPPVLPVYVQPVCPSPDLMWTPGHWAWDPDYQDYYWVPGAWVPAPYAGALWTPGYWGWSNGVFMWHTGYWGPHIGYYGGVNYGGGYMGIGYAGGQWNGGSFAYNTAVVNVNRTTITNVYVNQTIVQQTTIINDSHVSYSGGPGGVQHVATQDEQIAERDQHVQMTSYQTQHMNAARADRSNFSRNNGGRPTNYAVARPLQAENHPAPAGYRPPAARPMTELARVQAPPSVQHAAMESSAKTSVAVRNNPQPPVHATPAGQAHTLPTGQPQAHPEPVITQGQPHPQSTPKPNPEASTQANQHPVPQPGAAPMPHPAPQSQPKPTAQQHVAAPPPPHKAPPPPPKKEPKHP